MLPGSAPHLGNPLAGVPLGYGDLAQRSKFAVPRRGDGVVLNGCVKFAGPGRVSLPYLPGGLRKTAVPSHETRKSTHVSIFSDFFRIQKNVEKTERQKSAVFAIFCDFESPRRRFFAIFGPFWDPHEVILRLFRQGKFSVVFFINFSNKNRKRKKVKSVF